MNTTPAGNAVRHGLSGLCHIPKGREAELGLIELELIKSRQPETPEQLEIVHELAFAMWQKGEHERVMFLEAEKLANKAGDLFDQKALEDYLKLHKLWLENPLKYTAPMYACKLGVEHFLECWQMIKNGLAEGYGPTLQLAITAVRTEGCSPSPHFITGEGIWIMTQTMSFKANIDCFIDEWLELVDADTSNDALGRAILISKALPDNESAYQHLCERAVIRLKHYTDLLQELSDKYDENRQDFISQYSVNVMSSEEFEKQVQRLHRYRVFTENRIKEFNRRLSNSRAEILKKQRLQDEKEFRNLNHEIAVEQLERPQFEQLLEYRKSDDAKVAKSAQKVILRDEDLVNIPPDWQNHTAILTDSIPNAELFSLWTDEQLIESSQMIEYLIQQPSTNKHWIEQIRACQESELEIRSLTGRDWE